MRDKIGTEVEFTASQAIAARITQVYRERGYVLAQVVIPPQDVSSGNVELSVLEGRVAHVRLDVGAGTPIREDLLRARDRADSGRRAAPAGRARTHDAAAVGSAWHRGDVGDRSGQEPGTVDLTISVTPAKRWTFRDRRRQLRRGAERRTWRLGALARLNSPFMIGDNLDLRLLGSERLDTAYRPRRI